MPDPNFISPPEKGSPHSRGVAVDLTLTFEGEDIDMGTEFDEFSRLSYDISGSYMDLDMSILEPNYLYQISFLQKDGNNYIEQKEKFKFRVDP